MKCQICESNMKETYKDATMTTLHCEKKCGYEMINIGNHTIHDYKGKSLSGYFWKKNRGLIGK